ncbi:trehalose-phosphatase [Deinococcus deserti]|uniref:Trehalose 6-phosphate phosphatase n=1 Tax=Deinococcus deserti (strain DSM 17065 / CIP 109153 / LMG 22923 / VCD115) TaxID=546414 RepID=C1CYY1_DEIDV|nr:trehalose-phosphatase [Deinococcus deserti]ACO47161.1 putative trehalose-phosphatase (Trehalose 6-phosphate phosphatase) (TPP) [Deinococcus deserti VCD115]
MNIADPLLNLRERPLLVICDYDGTLAPIVTRPEDAVPEPGAPEALKALLAAGHHRAAVVTGRRVAEAAAFLNVPELMVVGLHGMEWPDQELHPPDTAALQIIKAALPDAPGVRHEEKGWTLAVHYREVPEPDQPAVETALSSVPVPPGWEVIAGKKVREFRPSGHGKGRAALRLAAQFPGHLPVFLGDDVTDEEAFAALRERGGVTVKVGEGQTAAEYRVASPAEVVALLRVWAEPPGG